MPNDVLLGSNAEAPGTLYRFPVVVARTGNITANAAANTIGPFPFPVRVVDVVGSVLTNGVDATNPLSLAFQVQRRAPGATSGTNVLSTAASIAKEAGTGARSTTATATGIVKAVVNPAQAVIPAGTVLSVDFTITRTASPGTEIANPAATVWLAPQGGADERDYVDGNEFRGN